jgi:hypothetical protein
LLDEEESVDAGKDGITGAKGSNCSSTGLIGLDVSGLDTIREFFGGDGLFSVGEGRTIGKESITGNSAVCADEDIATLLCV